MHRDVPSLDVDPISGISSKEKMACYIWRGVATCFVWDELGTGLYEVAKYCNEQFASTKMAFYSTLDIESGYEWSHHYPGHYQWTKVRKGQSHIILFHSFMPLPTERYQDVYAPPWGFWERYNFKCCSWICAFLRQIQLKICITDRHRRTRFPVGNTSATMIWCIFRAGPPKKISNLFSLPFESKII